MFLRYLVPFDKNFTGPEDVHCYLYKT